MKNFLTLLTFALLSVFVLSVRGDLLDCDEKKLPTLADVPIIGPKVASEEESAEHQVRDFFKNVGCELKKGAAKVSEQAKKLGSELKESAKKLSAKAKEYGTDIKEKFDDFKDRFSDDSAEERKTHGLLRNVEIINPDILKAEQQCGHGHILDALGNCSKLRK